MKFLFCIVLMVLVQSTFAQLLPGDKGVESGKERPAARIIKNPVLYKTVDTVKIIQAKGIVYVGKENTFKQSLPFKVKNKITYKTDIDAIVTTVNNNTFKVYMARKHANVITIYIVDGDVLKGKLYYKVQRP
ncbi:MAG: hypothetical protein ACKOXB_04080 [Flavobacteriales bacterium]